MKVPKNQNKKAFFAVIAVIAVLAVISRLFLLGARPVHHDEGMLSYFAWQLVTAKNYSYTPQIHGPVLFYVQAALFALFKTSNFVVRLGPALFGIVLVALPLFCYKNLGRTKAVVLSLLFLISPIFLYYSRFLVHTSLAIVFYLAFVYFLYSFVVKPSSVPLYLCGVFLAFCFGTSEATYIFIAVMVLSVALTIAISSKRSYPYLLKVLHYFRENIPDLISAVLLFGLVYTALYSVGFTNAVSFKTSLPNPFSPNTGLGFWLSQHKIHLGGQPWFYYLLLAAVYEPVIFLGSVFALVDAFKKRTPAYLFIAFWAVLMMVGLSWAGEKFPWLFLPALLPLTVLTGYYFASNWPKFKTISKIIWIMLAAMTIFTAIRLNYYNFSADTRELVVYVQTPPSFQKIIDKIDRDCKGSSDASCVLIDQKISWPPSWDFKDYSTLIYPENFTLGPNTKYAILDNSDVLSAGAIKNWKTEQVTLRDWWVPDPCRKISCVPRYLNYFFTRNIWNDKGGFDVTILTPQN